MLRNMRLCGSCDVLYSWHYVIIMIGKFSTEIRNDHMTHVGGYTSMKPSGLPKNIFPGDNLLSILYSQVFMIIFHEPFIRHSE